MKTKKTECGKEEFLEACRRNAPTKWEKFATKNYSKYPIEKTALRIATHADLLISFAIGFISAALSTMFHKGSVPYNFFHILCWVFTIDLILTLVYLAVVMIPAWYMNRLRIKKICSELNIGLALFDHMSQYYFSELKQMWYD